MVLSWVDLGGSAGSVEEAVCVGELLLPPLLLADFAFLLPLMADEEEVKVNLG